jgi:hypothetical protein
MILIGRWAAVLPLNRAAATRAMVAAATLSAATIGGGYPLLWALVRHRNLWFERGQTTFTFAGNLPPGVDEDELLVMLVFGLIFIIIHAVADVRDCLVPDDA